MTYPIYDNFCEVEKSVGRVGEKIEEGWEALSQPDLVEKSD